MQNTKKLFMVNGMDLEGELRDLINKGNVIQVVVPVGEFRDPHLSGDYLNDYMIIYTHADHMPREKR